jgi:hypothetical protein
MDGHDIITDALDRIEQKIDRVAASLAHLQTDHARLEEKFLAHDKLGAEEQEHRRTMKVGLTWPLIVTLAGAIATAWAPTLLNKMSHPTAQVAAVPSQK